MNRGKSKDSVPVSYAKWQDEIDRLTVDYLDKHPDFVGVATQKDAALKGKTPEIVKQLLATYSGVMAVAAHERANELFGEGKEVDAAKLAGAAKSRTGIDIHPATKIGDNLFIDHGTGVVIGETAKVGKRTLLYHGVTLGAYGNPEESDPKKLVHRHPEVGDDCTISTGVKILGNVKVGNKVTVGVGAVVCGNNLKIGNDVLIGGSARIGDNNTIADGVKIGTGAVIEKDVGEIKTSIPPYSHVKRNKIGTIEIIESDGSKHTSMSFINNFDRANISLFASHL